MSEPTPEQIEAGARAYDPEAWAVRDRLAAEGSSDAAFSVVGYSLTVSRRVLAAVADHNARAASAAPSDRGVRKLGAVQGILAAAQSSLADAARELALATDAIAAAPQEPRQLPGECDDDFIGRMKTERPDLTLEDLGFVESDECEFCDGYGDAPPCRASIADYLCTRQQGHAGPHVACGVGEHDVARLDSKR